MNQEDVWYMYLTCKIPYFLKLEKYIDEKCFGAPLYLSEECSPVVLEVGLGFISTEFLKEIIVPWIDRWHTQFRKDAPKPEYLQNATGMKIVRLLFSEEESQLYNRTYLWNKETKLS